MDVANLKGAGGIDRGAERTVKIPRPHGEGRHGDGVGDSATISEDSRQRLQAVDQLIAKARGTEHDRAQIVEEARARLESGALDAHDVHRAVAERILRGDA